MDRQTERPSFVRTRVALVLVVAAGLVGQMPAFAATQCVPAANPGPCDAFHATIQDAIAAAGGGDTVLVGPGTYAESPNVNKSLILTSNGGRDVTTIELQAGPTYLGSLQISGADVTVDGFTIKGRDAACPTLAASNVYMFSGLGDIRVLNNRIQVGQIDGACSNGDDGFGVLTTYDPGNPADSLTVTGNIIEPLTAAGGRRAFYVNPGVRNFRFDLNTVTGRFTGTAITQAATGVVDQNLIDGEGLGGAGLGTWGFPDADDWGNTTFSYNVFTGLVRGIAIFESNLVHLTCNLFDANGWGVEIFDGFGTADFDPTTISMVNNRFKFATSGGVNNAAGTAGTVDAEDNYWGAPNGPSGIGPGGGDAVLGDVDFDPFLTSSAIAACDPLAVKLDSFTASWTDEGIVVRWATISEKETAGFRVLRATGSRKLDAVELLTMTPVPPAGSEIQGASYEFLDAEPPTNGTILYFLEEIDNRGKVTRYGPVSLEPQVPAGTRTRGAVRSR